MTRASGTLEIDGVSFRAGERTLIENISLSVAPGEIVGLLGPNGAGKSTLLRTIYRINRPARGRVLVDGENVWQRSTEWVARQVGAVLQDMPGEFPLTVRDVVTMGRTAHKRLLQPDTVHDKSLVEAAIELLQLDDLQLRPFRTLSGGERQRALMARALVQQPRLLVLDEPTNHLDIHHQLQFLRFVRDLDITVIAALHDLNLAAMFCDRLCLLEGGRVVATGTPDMVLSEGRLREVYRIDATIQRHPRSDTVWVVPY